MKSTDNSTFALSRLLREHDIIPTAQRVKIASAILSRPQHVSADQVMLMANEDGQPVSKATVYNTLGLFARKGLIKELVVDPSRIFYDSSTHHHYHFYNRTTQELSDVYPDEVEVTLPTTLPPGTEISDVDVIIHLQPSS